MNNPKIDISTAGFEPNGVSIVNSETKHNRRDSITEEGAAKFVHMGAKMVVLINDDDELATLSDYLDMDLQDYFSDYFGGFKKVTPIVINCRWKLSLAGDMEKGLAQTMAIAFGQDLWSESKENSISLDVFMNPSKYPEMFV